MFPVFPHRSKHFNPRSREGSDAKTLEPYVEFVHISIHAPAKGATCPRRSSSRCAYFNPRSREGSDVSSSRLDVCVLISIHAPAKGATLCAYF